MNQLSAFPVSTSDARLSSPEAAAPNAVDAALQARRQKLRRIVAWVVGGATVLACVGLALGAARAHSQHAADAAALAAQAQLAATKPAPTAVASAATADASSTAAVTPTVNASSAVAATNTPTKAVAAKPVKHVNRGKRTTAKTGVTHH